MLSLTSDITGPSQEVTAEVHARVRVDPCAHALAKTFNVLSVKHGFHPGPSRSVCANKLVNFAIGTAVVSCTELAQVGWRHVLALELSDGLDVLAALGHGANAVHLVDNSRGHISTGSGIHHGGLG